MSGRDIRDTVGLLAVVASLIFVGLQIRQGTVAQRSATLEGVFAERTELTTAAFTDDGTVRLIRRFNEGATSTDLTVDDVEKGRLFILVQLRVVEAAQRQVEIGVLSDQETANTFAGISPIAAWPFFRDQWPTLQRNFAPDFISYLEDEFFQ